MLCSDLIYSPPPSVMPSMRLCELFRMANDREREQRQSHLLEPSGLFKSPCRGALEAIADLIRHQLPDGKMYSWEEKTNC